MYNYTLTGLILLVLAVLMWWGKLDIIIARYKSFQEMIRRTELDVLKNDLRVAYSFIFFV